MRNAVRRIVVSLVLTVLAPQVGHAQSLELVARWTSSSVGGSTLAVVDGRGRVFITGASTGWSSVAVHDLDTGELLGTVGRKGRGPGEFINIRGIATRGDSLAVLDGATLRITVFDPDLRVTETIRVPMRIAGRLAWGPDGFIVGGWGPIRARGTPANLWRITRDHQRHELQGVGVDSVGHGTFIFVTQGDSILALRESSLGAWTVHPGPRVAELIDEPSYSPQVQRDLPDFIVTLDGARGGAWIEGRRLLSIHTRFLEEHEFPACETCPPPKSTPRMRSLLRVTDLQSGAIESETQLELIIDGVLEPGVVWSGALNGTSPMMSIWRLSVPGSSP